MKLARQTPISLKTERQFQTNVALLHGLSHPNIVSFLGACCWKVAPPPLPLPRVYFEMSREYEEGGSDMEHEECMSPVRQVQKFWDKTCWEEGRSGGSLCATLLLHGHFETTLHDASTGAWCKVDASVELFSAIRFR